MSESAPAGTSPTSSPPSPPEQHDSPSARSARPPEAVGGSGLACAAPRALSVVAGTARLIRRPARASARCRSTSGGRRSGRSVPVGFSVTAVAGGWPCRKEAWRAATARRRTTACGWHCGWLADESVPAPPGPLEQLGFQFYDGAALQVRPVTRWPAMNTPARVGW